MKKGQVCGDRAAGHRPWSVSFTTAVTLTGHLSPQDNSQEYKVPEHHRFDCILKINSKADSKSLAEIIFKLSMFLKSPA